MSLDEKLSIIGGLVEADRGFGPVFVKHYLLTGGARLSYLENESE